MNAEYFSALDMRKQDKSTAFNFSFKVRAGAWEKAIEIVKKGGVD